MAQIKGELLSSQKDQKERMDEQIKGELEGRRIDGFLERCQKANIPPKTNSELGNAVAKWQPIMQQIDSLVTPPEAPSTSTGWVVHSSPVHHLTAAALRKQGRLQVRYSFKLAEGLESLCKMMANPAGYKELLPFCVESREVQVEHHLEKQVLISYKAPFLTERTMLLRLMAVDRLDTHSSIIVFAKGPTSEEMAKFGQVRGEWVKLKTFVAEIKIGQQDYTVNTIASFDDALSSLPDFLVKKLLQLSSAALVSNLKKGVKNGFLKDVPTGNEQVMRCIEKRLKLKCPGRL